MSRARAYERKRGRSHRVLEAEGRSSLRGFFTGGVELDDSVDPGLVGTFFADALRFLNAWEVPPGWGEGVEIKLRRLGQHKAEGLFYPEPPIIVLDHRGPSSFAHEIGHLLDYTCSRALGGAEASMGPSSGEAFGPFLEAMRRRMRAAAPTDARFSGRKGRVSWAYFASAPECFARAFEQCTAELLGEPCVLVRPRERYRSDPLFF
ncbi:MAG: hypothetical protein HY721_29210, partial [Planctomycetes bacterium]|nr:hypothetical protein [Planctomycetota bacterium]